MFPLIIGLAITLIIATLAGRFGFRRAQTLFELGKYAIMTTLAAFFLFVLGLAFLGRAQGQREPTELPVLTSYEDALRSEANGRNVILEGVVSAENDIQLGTEYVAYVEVVDEGVGWIERPELKIDMNGGTVMVESDIYEDVNWHEEDGVFERTYYLLTGDPVVVYGYGYLGRFRSGDVDEERLYLGAPFVFKGSAEEFSAEYAPTLRRRASYAQIASTFSFIAAGVVLLSPLPRGARIILKE